MVKPTQQVPGQSRDFTPCKWEFVPYRLYPMPNEWEVIAYVDRSFWICRLASLTGKRGLIKVRRRVIGCNNARDSDAAL